MRDIWTLWRASGALVCVAALVGCSSVSGLLDSSTTQTPAATAPAGDTPPPKDSLTNMILGRPTPGPTAADEAFKADDLPCPEVTVRAGASTLSLGSKPGEVSAMDLRYQGSLVRFARECKAAAGVMTMKVGIEGRVIAGPAGGPGTVEVPLRLAVVEEGPNPKTVLSKLARVPVTVTPENTTVDFTHIDSEVAFPLPRPLAALERYVVYVGFDPTATAPKPQPSRRRR